MLQQMCDNIARFMVNVSFTTNQFLRSSDWIIEAASVYEIVVMLGHKTK